MACNSTTNSATTDTSGSIQQTEVSSIKADFPNRCRVISDGEFSKIVTIQPESMDVTIKFQLPAAYPSIIPEISIRSESLTENKITDLRQLLRSKAEEMLGQQMIRFLIAEAETQLRALGLKPGKAARITDQLLLGKNQPKNRKQKIKPKCEDDIENKKLPPMKTADDVVKRIIWDDALDKDDFIVGYVDRFRGLVEMCFSAFSWEDLSSVDYDVLAVPKHRIQYFKYRDVKVWDKTKRMDNIFGSAEGTKTIDLIIKELQEMERADHAGKKTCKTENDNSDEDSSNDDDVEIIRGNVLSVSTTDSVMENTHHDYAVPDNSCIAERTHKNNNPHSYNKLRANHFLCIRITNEDLLDKLGKFQDHLIEQDPLLSECCISGASLHVTIATLGLDTPDQVLQCLGALRKFKPHIELTLSTFNLRLHGVSHFNNQTIYAHVQHKREFHELCVRLKQTVHEAGVQIRDGYDFLPHVTVMKMTKPVAQSRGTKHIQPELYSNYEEIDFGEQKVDKIFLCSMGKQRREDGFYLTSHEFDLEI